MNSRPVWVGLAVAQETLDVAVRPSGEQWRTPNTESGIADLLARLQPLVPGLIVCEATGGFERAAIGALAAAGLPVVVANPRQIRDFAKATGQLAKTDRIDAGILTLLAERVRPTPRERWFAWSLLRPRGRLAGHARLWTLPDAQSRERRERRLKNDGCPRVRRQCRARWRKAM